MGALLSGIRSDGALVSVWGKPHTGLCSFCVSLRCVRMLRVFYLWLILKVGASPSVVRT